MVVSKALQCQENVSPSSHSKVYFHCTCIQDRHGKNFEVTFHTFCRNYGARVYSECLLTGLSLIHNWSYMSVQLLMRKRKAEKLSYVFKKKKNETINETSLTGYETIIFQVYSYFEKGWRKKCTRQSRKVLWVVLNSLFFKGVWKNDTRGHGRMFASGKRKQQKYVRQLQCQEQCIDHIPYYLSGLPRAHFFRQPFSK